MSRPMRLGAKVAGDVDPLFSEFANTAEFNDTTTMCRTPCPTNTNWVCALGRGHTGRHGNFATRGEDHIILAIWGKDDSNDLFGLTADGRW
jgi:hypothetical protein